MRPCNQCRRPVENDVVICAACQQKNQMSGNSPVPEPPRIVTETPASQENAKDYSFDALVWGFVVITIALGGMIGLATSQWTGAWAGALVGLFIGCVFIAISRRI